HHYSYFPQKFDGFNYIYAVRMGGPPASAGAGSAPKDLSSLTADYLLLDSYDENQHGGTGKTFDWSQLAKLDTRRTFLAGGLGPLNICAAARISPYALDLSSSVEISPGIKDPNKLQQLFENLRDCDVTNPEKPAGS
ncbi:MAG TPA: phosphoribosylanthranilate isomerase, partial [Alphaproteobacteria bacterium]|nr:phosphoribosylanthranilate isomerase [Alphaproteobacteria bacterium]